MKIKYISPLVTAGMVAVASMPALAQAESPLNLSFSCQVENGIPVTVVQGEGVQQPIFHWDSAKLPESVDSELVCNEVATKLSNSVSAGYDMTNLKFISSQQGGLPAICATQDDTECSLVLFTIEPTEKASEVAKSFLSSIIDKDLKANKVEVALVDRGFQSTVYPVNIMTLLFGRKFLK